MKFMPLKKKAKECFLALDVGTEAVKALVFEKEQKCFILGSALEYFDDSRPFDNEKVILRVAEEAVGMSGKTPAGLLLTFPADILRSRVSFKSINRRKPEKIIQKKEEQGIHQFIFKETEKEVAESFARNYGIMPQDIQFVDFEILEIKIDGYNVPVLSGYSGENLEFRILATFLPKDYLNKFKKVIKNPHFKFQKIINPVKGLAGALEIASGIFLDVGGQVTQICLVRNGRIDMINEFRRGGEDFSLAISQALGMRSAEARYLKERYARGELTEETRKRIKEIMAPACREWLFGLKSKIKAVKGLLPSAFLLFGGGSQLPEIEELISEEENKIKLVYPKDFKNIVDGTHFINNPQYINVILLCYAPLETSHGAQWY